MQDQVAELRKKIQAMEQVGETAMAEKFKAELAKLEASNPAAKGTEAVFELSITEDELAQVSAGGANRPPEGEYEAEIGYPELNYTAKSAKVPFTIIRQGQWAGWDKDAFYPSKSAGAEFSIKNICAAAGIASKTNPKTGKAYYDLMELAGKKIVVVYENETSMFTGSDGVERQVTRAKVKRAKPLAEKAESLGI